MGPRRPSASRFVLRAHGYDYTFVNGKVFIDHDELTAGDRAT
jgi:hypothetical protein